MNTPFILETSGLSKEFKGFSAVRGVDLRVRRGHVHALIGPNGAGKTTCFNLLTKFLSPTAGEIRFNGQDITGLSPSKIARLGIIRSFQISATFPNLTVLENVQMALQQRAGLTIQFWKGLRVLDRLQDRAHELLAQVGLESFAQELSGSLPYGRKRALEIATTLAMDPELLLLDEPTQGMGREDVELTTQLIKRVSSSRTVLMVEHNLGVVSRLADRITVLQRGEILAEGAYEEVSQDERVRTAYMGGGSMTGKGSHVH
ncbi:MAG TPA: ABC transporter ATP-binding protein [Terriglobales bacterium]|jgi:branched-chain amino acid transport system ATP-binding protein|nr:ABC transporter ATP-binding protein [Terriglobales bacterium]